MALILRQYFFCGGALIASRWVLTSAACMFNNPATGTQPYTADELKIVLGEHNTNSSSESQIPRKVVAVSKIITHPSYSASTFNNDIALIQLSEEVDLNVYTPSCIAMTSANFKGQKAWVYGEKIFTLINILIILKAGVLLHLVDQHRTNFLRLKFLLFPMQYAI